MLQIEIEIANEDCQQIDERIGHIMSARSTLAKERYIERNYRVCAQLHFNICKEVRVRLDSEHWNEHAPKSVEPSHEGTNRCKPTEPFLTLNWTSQSGIMEEQHVC